MIKKPPSKRKFTIPAVAKLVGFRLIKAENGQAVCALQTGKKHINTIGTVHGGILCDLSDAAMGFAFLSLLPVYQMGVTIEFKINFLKSVFASDKLLAAARTISAGKSIYYLECEIRNAKKRLVAKAACTCKVING